MAGALNNPSRLGVTLQGYHQVIALSQAHINQTLKYHFTVANDSLCNFKATTKATGKPFMTGTLKAPVIELIDKEDADQAIFILEFKNGVYGQWDFKDDPMDPDAPPTPVKVTTPATGWKIAFWVSFSMQKMGRIPDSIRNKVELPGSYSVDQLLIDFGTADMLDINLDRCEVPGTKPEDVARVKNRLKDFTEQWITETKLRDATQSHNILGYAVKIDIENSAERNAFLEKNKLKPEFTPTAVRLQTINHRADGQASSTSTANPLNAFLFTEMTDGAAMIAKDLQWSGNWFYESIGGTLCLSKSNFWDKYLVPKLNFMNGNQIKAMNEVARAAAGNVFASKETDWMLEEKPSYTNWVNVGSTGYHSSLLGVPDDSAPGMVTYSWSGKRGHHADLGNFAMPQDAYFDLTYSLENTVGAMKGSNSIRIVQSLSSKSTWKFESVNMMITKYRFVVDVDISWKRISYITFRSVDSTGTLSVDVTTTTDKPKIEESHRSEGLAVAIANLFRDAQDKDTMANKTTTAVELALGKITDIGKEVENILNTQNKFVFPGGGTFDMKDPIFNNNGDLLIGLTYRNGEAK